MTEPRDPEAAPAQLAEGALIAGRYRLGPVIGRGGMATIHRAMDERTERPVAVKLLRPEVLADADLAQRFRREALAATVLRHPNIVACLDTGTADGQPYLIMELVDGEDLAARLRRSGRLAPWQVARIGLDVARALGVAHQRGIVHRDVKPGNILLAADGRAMVTDFGIARLAADAEASMPGTTLGSVHYFSPEQARGVTTTPASDVYSLGLVLFEALTGQRAWTGDTTDAIALARVGATAPSPRSIRPEIPPDLEAVVLRALSPDASDRYPNGTSVAAALEPIVSAPATALTDVTTSMPLATAGSAASAAGVGAVAASTSSRQAATGRVAGPSVAPPLVPMRAGPLGPAMTAASGAGRTVAPSGGAGGFGGFGVTLGRPVTGILMTILVVIGIGAGILAVMALPGGGPGGLAAVGRSPAATRSPSPSPRPTASPTPETPSPSDIAATDPTAAPTPVKTRAPVVAANDLCQAFFGVPCGLDAGRYRPSAFQPSFDMRLGEGWSAAANAPSLMSVTRDEGRFTVASHVGDAKARQLIEALVVADGVSATRPARLKIDGHRGYSTDVTTLDGASVSLFENEATNYVLEPGRTTRVVALDVDGETIVMVIEPTRDSTLQDLLKTADDVAGSMRFR